MKYIAFYETEDYYYENRSVAPSAANVVRYMAEIISEHDAVEIISPSRTLNKKGFYPKRVQSVSDKIMLVQPPTFGAGNSILRILSVTHIRIWLFLYLLTHLKRGEEVIVYHSLSYTGIMTVMKAVFRLKLIEEVREVYADVKESYADQKALSERKRKKEVAFFSIADKYIFPSELMNQTINRFNRPYIIATGIYKPERVLRKRTDDNTVHVVYAGTLRPEKGGFFAASAAAYLPENYHVHILGYGSEDIVKRLEEHIASVSAKKQAKLTYDGLLHGEEFSAFLQSCHIGVVTQNPKGSFNDSSFPSKVLTYLVNDLEVLSSNIPAVRESPVGEYVHYYDSQTPESLALAIQQIDIHHTESKREVMQELDQHLRGEMTSFLQ